MGARHFLRSPQLSSLHCHLKNLKLLGAFHQNAHVVWTAPKKLDTF